MPVWIRNYVKILIAACLVISFCLIEGDAQTRRKKRSRRATHAAPKPVITNPTIAPPDSAKNPAEAPTEGGDVKIISTADASKDAAKDSSSESLQGWKPKVTAPAPTEEEIERAARDHDDMLVREIERALAARDPQRRETVFTFLLPELLQFDPARVVEMVKRQEPGEARDALRTEVARHWIMRDVDATVGWMKSLQNEAERRDAAEAAVSTLSAFAPDQAIAVAEEFGVGRQDGYLEHLAQIWAESDLPAAEAWAHSQRDNPQSAPLRARIDAVRVAQSQRGDDRGDEQ